MARPRSSLIRLCAALLVGAAMLLVHPGAAAASGGYPLDPTKNIGLPAATMTTCDQHPYSGTCKRMVIRALNHARAAMGEPAYLLPPRFASLTGPEQLLVLSNADRRLYGRRAVIALNAPLNASAQRGATLDSDPAFISIGGSGPALGASNWAGGARSPLVAYYLWMYADGPTTGGSGNVGCRQPGDASCWDHRHATLMGSGSTDKLVMGVGHGTGPSGMPAWTELYEAFWPEVWMTYVPTVTVLSTHYGSRGTAVTITGYGFVHVRGVTFGSTPAGFRVVSGHRIVAVAPAGVRGPTHVRVTTSGGVSNATPAAAFSFG